MTGYTQVTYNIYILFITEKVEEKEVSQTERLLC